MKPLILILLTATWAQAQGGVADAARVERARQAKSQKSIWVLKTDDIKTAAPAPAEPAADAAAVPGEAPAPAEAAKAETPAAPPANAAAQKWFDETNALRDKVRDLLDQETEAQLEINAYTNQIYAPVASQAVRAEAMIGLEAANKRLASVRDELTRNRTQLEQREKQGPPK